MADEGKVLTLQGSTLPPQAGHYARLLCMTGEKKGTSYYLMGKRIVLGRERFCDIQVLDTNASREHAEIVMHHENYIITDLNSNNGTYIDDEKITQYDLREGSRIIIGATVYRFSYVDVTEQGIQEEKNKTKQKEKKEKKKEKVSTKQKKSEMSDAEAAKQKRKKLIYGVVILGLFAFLMGEEEPQNNKKRKKNVEINFEEDGSDITKALSRKQKKESKELDLKLATIYQRGLREYREKNYFRAINEFNLALILSPNDSRASYYLNKTKQALDNDIKKKFIDAKRDYEALRYRKSITNYCAIVRLLQNYPSDQRYKDATQNIRDIEKLLGLEVDEVKCI